MKTMQFRALLLGASSFGVLALASPALAQSLQPIPPEHYTLDQRGVDLVNGTFVHASKPTVIGPAGAGGLSHNMVYLGGASIGGWRDTVMGSIEEAGSVYTVSIGAESEIFTRSGSTFTPVSNNGSTLVLSGSEYVYTSAMGSVARFSGAGLNVYRSNLLITSYTQPDGSKTEFHYASGEWCTGYDPEGECIQYVPVTRLQSVTNNRGYQLHYDYVSEDPLDGDWRTML